MSHAPIIGRNIVRHIQVQSTSDLVREFAERGEPEGLVLTAEEQLAGRGRLDHKWIVPPATSIQLSILLRPSLSPHTIARITQMAALAVMRTLERELNLEPVLKWPNDVLLPPKDVAPDTTKESFGGAKKVAGILTETSLRGETLEYCVLGIGLNVNYTMYDYPDLAADATTCQDAVGHSVDRAALEQALLTELDGYYARVQHSESLLDEYRARLVMLGTPIRVATSTSILEGIAEQVADDGALVLLQGNTRVKLYAGDVTLLKTPASTA